MMIRRATKIKGLATGKTGIKIFGGDKDLCMTSVGFFAGGEGLQSAPKSVRGYADGLTGTPVAMGYFPEISQGLAVTDAGKVYIWLENEKLFSEIAQVENYPVSMFSYSLDGENYAAVVCGNKMICRFADTVRIFTLPYYIKGACLHMGRVFAADANDGYVLRWSCADDMGDWGLSASGGGYIRLRPERGKILSLIPLGDRIIAVREHGTDIIKAYGDPRHFSVVHKGCGEVTEALKEGTCVACGESVYFCSDSSVYEFDGEHIQKLQMPVYMRAHGYSAGCAHDGRYVTYACREPVYDGAYHLLYDTYERKFAFFAANKSVVWKTQKGFYSLRGGYVYEPADGGEFTGVWMTDALDFGIKGAKLLKRITVRSEGNIEVSVKARGETRDFPGNGIMTADIAGEDFTFSVFGDGKLISFEGELEVRK